MSTNLDWLQHFYLSLCDGDWEHTYGLKIENCDNPGWLFEFELTDTPYENAEGPDITQGSDQANDGPDWLFLRKNGAKIEGACGPLKLDQLLGHFRLWIMMTDDPEPGNVEYAAN